MPGSALRVVAKTRPLTPAREAEATNGRRITSVCRRARNCSGVAWSLCRFDPLAIVRQDDVRLLNHAGGLFLQQPHKSLLCVFVVSKRISTIEPRTVTLGQDDHRDERDPSNHHPARESRGFYSTQENSFGNYRMTLTAAVNK